MKQGCPLSAILFNLTMELILRQCKTAAANLPRGPLKHHGMTISILAYADDLVILAQIPADLQSLLNSVSSAADSLSLTFCPDKCSSLSLNKTSPRIRPDILMVQNQAIPAMTKEDHYLYLGIPIGLVHNVTNLASIIDELTTKLIKIQQSLLAPWQKLDAIHPFIQPCLTYALRLTDRTTKSLQDYQSQLICTVREICALPTRAMTHYFFASKRAGGLGLTDPCVENHLQTIVQATKMLSSSNPIVTAIAKRELRQFFHFAAQAEPTPALILSFFSNTPDRRLDQIRSRTGSLWTQTRQARQTRRCQTSQTNQTMARQTSQTNQTMAL